MFESARMFGTANSTPVVPGKPDLSTRDVLKVGSMAWRLKLNPVSCFGDAGEVPEHLKRFEGLDKVPFKQTSRPLFCAVQLLWSSFLVKGLENLI